MNILIGRNTITEGYHAIANNRAGCGSSQAEALGQLVLLYPELFPGLLIASDHDGDSLVREMADAFRPLTSINPTVNPHDITEC